MEAVARNVCVRVGRNPLIIYTAISFYAILRYVRGVFCLFVLTGHIREVFSCVQ